MNNEIINGIPSNIYVVDTKTRGSIYANDATKNLIDIAKKTFEVDNPKCYQAIYGYDEVCSFCKIPTLLKEDTDDVVEFEAFNELNNKWYEIRENLIHSSNGKVAKYSIAHDITKTKTIQQDLTSTFAELVKSEEKVRKLNLQLEEKVKDEVAKVKAQEKYIFEQAKMASLGEMIGNIAHQWRQPLSAISTVASGVKVNHQFDMLKMESIPGHMDSIVKNAKFLSETIDTFRDFIKEDKEFKSVCIQDDIDKALSLASASLTESNIKIINEIDYSKKVNINLITGEIPQVIINILNNAKDAIIEQKIKEEDRWIKLNMKVNQDNLIIMIEDNAGGIPGDTIDKVFEPYFTTKHKAQGTGIGLYMSYDIIKKHMSGHIFVKNTPNGAKFYIELPFEKRKIDRRRGSA